MADDPRDENTVDTEAQVTGTHTGPVPVQQGREVDGDGSEKLEYGDPSKDMSKLPADQQPEQPQ